MHESSPSGKLQTRPSAGSTATSEYEKYADSNVLRLAKHLPAYAEHTDPQERVARQTLSSTPAVDRDVTDEWREMQLGSTRSAAPSLCLAVRRAVAHLSRGPVLLEGHQ